MVAAIARVRTVAESERASAAGLRFGDKGTHTSRTIMLAELRDLLAAVPRVAPREEYARVPRRLGAR
ncbi:MAG: hypothetical protein HOP29_03525 [Phycisphaerales bacterium]|nr:hypothetical protein [Phycisphaerales bacterium]